MRSSIVDAHLDLSYNALRGRDVLAPARDQRPDDDGIPSVGLPDLRAGGVGLICATIFCGPESPANPAGYRSPDEAHAHALRHLAWYQRTIAGGSLRLVTQRDDVPGAETPSSPASAAISSILLLEGADPLRDEVDVRTFHAAGVRIVGLAWKQTRHAGGTGAPGPLTASGREIVAAMDAVGMIHDLSHLAEQSFWDLLELTRGPLMASHSNCRAIVPTDRQLSDEMIRAVAEREGVVGINFFDKFLVPPAEYPGRRATLDDVVRHIRHMCDLIGDTAHVGLGTDMDGGLGRDQIPIEIQTSADLPRVGEALSAAGFPDEAVAGILGENWLRYFRKQLPEI